VFRQPEWSADPRGFEVSRGSGAGWAAPSVVETQAERWPSFVARVATPEPLGFSAETPAGEVGDEAAHNSIMVFAYALARAAHGFDRIAMLDWGGGLGQYGELARALMPEVTIDYACRDLPAMVAKARTLSPGSRFFDDDSCLSAKYDLVLSSSSLQYDEHWPALLDRLAGATRRFLLVTRLPVVIDAASYVMVQRPHRHGYLTQYAGWVIRRSELLDRASRSGLVLDREFLIQEHPSIAHAPAPCVYRGFLFRAASAAASERG